MAITEQVVSEGEKHPHQFEVTVLYNGVPKEFEVRRDELVQRLLEQARQAFGPILPCNEFRNRLDAQTGRAPTEGVRRRRVASTDDSHKKSILYRSLKQLRFERKSNLQKFFSNCVE